MRPQVRPRIFITQPVAPSAVARLRAVATVKVNPDASRIISKQALIAAVRKCDILFCLLHDRIDRGVIAANPRLRAIAAQSISPSNIDVAEATARLIPVTVVPPVTTEATADLTFGLEMSNLEMPYTQYTAAIAEPPEGSELADEGYIAWALARRLGIQFTYFGHEIDMDVPPADDTFLSILASNAAVPYEELKRTAVGGRVFDDLPPVIVEAPSGFGGRLSVMPRDVEEELRAYAAAAGPAKPSDAFPLRMISRRIREVSNTSCRHFPSARKRAPYNPLCAHPDDLSAMELGDGSECWVVSDNGRIPAITKADSTLKRGVVSMTHGYGWIAGDEVDYREQGSSISLLVSLDRDCEPLQAMPRMSGVPVRLEAR